MSDTVKHDFDAAETLSRQFDAHFTTMKDHHARTTRARTRAVSGRGGDKLGQIVSDMADRALGAIETALDSLADHAKDVSKGLKKMNENHQALEKKLADDYKKIISGHDTTPVYLLDHKGDLHRLHADGSKTRVDKDTKDDSGIKDFIPNGNHPRFKVDPKSVPPVGSPAVNSRKVRTGGSELARATERARQAQGDYGTPVSTRAPVDKARSNYASLHYQDGERNFILVARSDFMKAHSEQRIAAPILDQLQGPNIRSLYTERAPCNAKGSNCGAWIHTTFPGLTDVSHSFDYSDDHTDHTNYLARLKQRRRQLHP
ncbi:nucleic acid/nucleotide deaminase domain-containing protein [Kitasatospora sp. NRRL B-11411]|uniref:nucleic acid/nucleotide deaminase domain-containing protein n=1 Tax=Kitasatospora sp. NRRL B-11411 TaxID=1463822 RepID=UPI0004C310D1|nr:nucleic acid/nucleotide deaminase domain-containing protein [Kitasatospora sp. NRRL B-11411]